MSIVWSSQLRSVLGCYCAGARRPASNPALSPADINAPHNQHLKRRLTFAEYNRLHQYVVLCEQGLSLARRDDLAAADQCFEQVHAWLTTRTLSSEGQLHAKVLYEKGVGYLDYRRGNLEQAEARMHEALAIDQMLEEEYGYTTLHADRIQLVYHLMRIYMKRTMLTEGLALGIHLLNYLEGKSHTLPISTSWNTAHLTDLPPRLLNHFFALVTLEMAYALAGQKTITVDGELLSIHTLLADIDCHTQPEALDSCRLSHQAHTWLQAKQALENEQLADFFSLTAQALSAGPNGYPLLWYAIIVDLLRLCDTLNVREAWLLRQRVAKDTAYWQRVVQIPRAWRPFLEVFSHA